MEILSGHPKAQKHGRIGRALEIAFGGRLFAFWSVLACTCSARTAASLKLGGPGGLDFSQAASRTSSVLWRRTLRTPDAFPDCCLEGGVHMNWGLDSAPLFSLCGREKAGVLKRGGRQAALVEGVGMGRGIQRGEGAGAGGRRAVRGGRAR